MQFLLFLPVLLLPASSNAQNFIIALAPNLVTSIFSKSAVFTLPPCNFVGTQATLKATAPQNSAASQSGTFSVPPCRSRRDVVTVADSSSNSFTIIKNIGYQITGLSPNTNYSFMYTVNTISGTASSNTLSSATLNPTPYQKISDSMARSGGMVVITVLLSIAMAILIVGLILTFVMGGRK
ncbi:uroplakin-2 [Rhinatrema bivittatum]|uniref:uroplakin-2 n=1 Tax=Rhinatrema bivittatum TaxID=194408 RepID=UPI00112B95AE|nr:uroplakin-2 [Rhinatrema bivittatum]